MFDIYSPIIVSTGKAYHDSRFFSINCSIFVLMRMRVRTRVRAYTYTYTHAHHTLRNEGEKCVMSL